MPPPLLLLLPPPPPPLLLLLLLLLNHPHSVPPHPQVHQLQTDLNTERALSRDSKHAADAMLRSLESVQQQHQASD